MGRGILNMLLSALALGLAGFIAVDAVPRLIAAPEPSSYGDWAVRCVERKDLPPCDIFQTLTDDKTKKPVMLISYSYAPARDQYAAQIMLPLGFMLPAGVLIRLDGKTDVTNYQITRCEPEGCFVEKLAKTAELDPFRKAEKGLVVVMGKNGKPIGFPFSLNGFGDALKSMAERNKRAAKPAQ